MSKHRSLFSTFQWAVLGLLALLVAGMFLTLAYLIFREQLATNVASFAVNPPTQGTVNLPTQIAASTSEPASVPKGRLVFTFQDRTHSPWIYTMNIDGSEQKQLTSTDREDVWPVWSPDGQHIAFASTRASAEYYGSYIFYDIYVMNADGSGMRQLTFLPNSDETVPAWSPDGNRIAFTSDKDGNVEIYVINVDGSGLTRLTNNNSNEAWPTWSADGRYIAFDSDRDDIYSREIYVMNSDGTNQRRLTNNSAYDGEPAWSPDGQKIAFNSSRDGGPDFSSEIYVMYTDGTNQQRITHADGIEDFPSWSPDGLFIVFQSDRHGINNTELYVIAADGTGETRLTNRIGHEKHPSWQP